MQIVGRGVCKLVRGSNIPLASFPTKPTQPVRGGSHKISESTDPSVALNPVRDKSPKEQSRRAFIDGHY